MKPYQIKVKALVSNKERTFDSLDHASKSTGISEYFFKQIRKGRCSNFIRGKNDILFEVTFIDRPVVVTLTPAWDTSQDENPATTMKFTSHVQAVNFLSEGGRYQCKRATYHRRKNEQPLGEPCATPILDCWDRPWIAVFYSKGEFVANKS